MIAPEQRKLLPFGNHPEMLPMLEQQLRLLEENIQQENQVITTIDQATAQRNQLLSTANLVSLGNIPAKFCVIFMVIRQLVNTL